MNPHFCFFCGRARDKKKNFPKKKNFYNGASNGFCGLIRSDGKRSLPVAGIDDEQLFSSNFTSTAQLVIRWA